MNALSVWMNMAYILKIKNVINVIQVANNVVLQKWVKITKLPVQYVVLIMYKLVKIQQNVHLVYKEIIDTAFNVNGYRIFYKKNYY